MSTGIESTTRVVLPRQLGDADRMRLFRRCFEALSEPGTVHELTADLDCGSGADGVVVAAAPMLVLSDLMCPLSALPGDAAATAEVEAIAAQTHAPVCGPDEARFALSLGGLDPSALQGLNRGTRERPHTAATVFVAVAEVAGDTGTGLRLEGPGIDGARVVRVTGLDDGVWAERQRLIDYPLGVDLVLIDPRGRVVAIPRTTAVEVIA